jgi:hypothetical protein
MVRYGHQYGIDELAAIVADFRADPGRYTQGDRAVLQQCCWICIDEHAFEAHAATGATPLARRDAEERWRLVDDFARWGR